MRTWQPGVAVVAVGVSGSVTGSMATDPGRTFSLPVLMIGLTDGAADPRSGTVTA